MHSSEVGPFVSKIRAVINDIGKHSYAEDGLYVTVVSPHSVVKFIARSS